MPGTALLSTQPIVLIGAFPFPMEFTWTKAAAFLFCMGLAGFLLGRLFGDEYRLLPRTGGRAGSVHEQDLERLADETVTLLESSQASPHVGALLQAMRSPNDATRLFPGNRVQRLVALLQESPAGSDPAMKPRWDQIYALLGHVAAMAPEDLRLPLACTLGRALPVHRGLTSPLLDCCKRHPGMWNDLQARFDEAASRDPAVARFLEGHAGPDQGFVRRANDQFMNEMERFRRLCEDRNTAVGAVVNPELKTMIDREFFVLELSRSASRRFMWLSSNARVTLLMLNSAQLDVLEGAVRQGIAPACALAARSVLLWAYEGNQERAVRMVEALAEAAGDHSTAADALFGLIHGIRPTRNHPKLNASQSAVRHHAYDLLQELSQRSYDVRATLITHGLFGASYEEPSDEDVTLDSTAF